ncbi:alpha/beta hydrolase [Thalassospira marina]|uniref:Alpha/beta hydrolase n=1 Tax=Thalassospira marina TaxID=2048283 RepID=A0A2N3KN33_9PROT|nr:alpha/beta hydrolase [Thalassospira marina]PKR51955.1 alpha/beta hydrolase [Thalassospira marina]
MTYDMPTLMFLDQPDGSKIAYHAIPRKQAATPNDEKPGILFLGGFMSDMTGTKATHLEQHCVRRGLAYTRFDYSGHGQSSGRFADGTIGQWARDAIAILDEVAHGPQILVGSSMGGWISLLAALARPDRVTGLIGIAAAPDFTEDLMWAQFSEDQKHTILEKGALVEPTEYGDDPYTITRALIEDGRNHLLLRDTINLDIPVRLVQGMEDPDVPWQTALKLAEKLSSNDVEIQLVKSGDHRLSKPAELDAITHHIDVLTGFAAG